MLRTTLAIFALALTVGLTGRAYAQASTNVVSPKLDPVLAAEAKISLDSARTIALHKVKNGSVSSEELEREHGHLIYSFDVKVPGKTGIQEVNVNALNGAVIGVHHEDAATERREAREDSVAAAKKAAARATPRT